MPVCYKKMIKIRKTAYAVTVVWHESIAVIKLETWSHFFHMTTGEIDRSKYDKSRHMVPVRYCTSIPLSIELSMTFCTDSTDVCYVTIYKDSVQ